MSEQNNFRISIGSDSDYEDFTAEIYFKNSFVAMITQEQGFNKLEIEIHPQANGKTWSFQLDNFLETIEKAKQGLWKTRRVDTPESH